MNPLLLKIIIQYLQSNDLNDEEKKQKLKEIGINQEIIKGILQIKNSSQKRQVDPTPSKEITREPSLILYTILFLIAFGLIVGTFIADEPDWSGLLLNLATEIIGAVILIIVIDRNYRQEEISELKTRTGNFLTNVKFLLSPDLRFLISYGKSIGGGLIKVRPEFYISRPELENKCLKYMDKGFYLYAKGGMGKTTLLQISILTQIKKFLNSPKKEALPILIPVRHLEGKDLLTEVIEETSVFREISLKRLKSLLRNGKIVLIFDGLDEFPNSTILHHEIQQLSKTHNNCPIVVSSREEFENPINNNKIVISDLNQKESMDFIKKRLDFMNNQNEE